MNLNEEQRQIVIDGSKYRFNAAKIAVLLKMPFKVVNDALNDRTSEIYALHAYGRASFLLETCRELEKKSNAGDRQATKELLRTTDKIIERQAIDEYFGD